MLTKIWLYVLLVAGPVVVRGQKPSRLFDAIPGWHPDSVLVQLPKTPPLASLDGDHGIWRQKVLVLPQPSVRILAPDRMACLIPDLTKVERMPVSRLRNADKMPNPLGGKASGHHLYH